MSIKYKEPSSGTNIATDTLSDNSKVVYVKILSGADANTNKATVGTGGALKVDGSAVTQPVSFDSLPLPTGAANENNQSLAITELEDINTALAGTLTVQGTVAVTQDTGTNLHAVIDSGTIDTITNSVTVVQSTATNLKVDLSGTGANSTAIKVDGSAVTQPVSGTVTIQDGGGVITVDGTVTVASITSITNPVTVEATNLDVRDLTNATDSVSIYGTDGATKRHLKTDSDGHLQVDLLSGTLTSITNPVTIQDGGGAITVDGTVTISGTVTLNANSGVDVGDVTINNASGASAVNIQDGGNSITVDGTVTATLGAGSASFGILGANSGVDIGDVTINNAAGASAVNIQDGGNSITIDGTITGITNAVTVAQSTAASLKTEIWGGAKGATTALISTNTACGTDHNAQDVLLRDSSGAELDFRTENENWNAADHGILVFGRDTESTPDKYRAINLNTEGDIYVDLSDINGVEPSVGTGNSNTGTLRVVLATDQPVVSTKLTSTNFTIKSKGGQISSSGNNTIVDAVADKKIKVFAFSLSTVETTGVTCIFQSGASGTELWRVILKAPSDSNSSSTQAVSLPTWLFETGVNTLLNVNLSGAQTVHYSVSYVEEA